VNESAQPAPSRNRGSVQITTGDGRNSNALTSRQPVAVKPGFVAPSKSPINHKRPSEILRERGRDAATPNSTSSNSLPDRTSRGERKPLQQPPAQASGGSSNDLNFQGKGPFQIQKPSATKKPVTSELQTLEKTPIKPAQFNGGILQNTSKGNFNKPLFDGPFKGPFKGSACGHSACSGHSACTLGSHFHHRIHAWDWHDHHHGCHSGLSFHFSTGGFSFGFNHHHPWHHWHHDWCSWPSWHSWHGSYWGCHCHTFHCIHKPVFFTTYYPTYYYPVYSDPIYYSSAEVYTPAPAPYETEPAPITGNAWDLLDEGNAREARRQFAREIDTHPNDGLPQIGYAIASTLIDRKIEATAMMRRALKNDPEAIHEVPQTQGLIQAMEAALDEFVEMSDRRADNVDAQFMIAAMRYMLGDVSRAFFAIDRATDWGDKDASAVNLHGIIRKAMEQPAQPAPAPSTAPAGQPAYSPMMEFTPVQPPTILPEEKPFQVPF
jgi:hypothetical protein